MKFVLASHNQKKLRELQTILGELQIEVALLPEGAPEPVEDGETFAANARIKAKAACALTGLPAIADDSGLCIDALQGAPGVYSARYGSEAYQAFAASHGLPTVNVPLADTADDEARTRCVLENMEQIPDGQRRAQFVSAICCVFPDGQEIHVQGACEGEITRSMEGNGGFGYDPIFFVPAFGCTFGELPAENKNQVSHRGNALRQLKTALQKRL